MSLQAHTESSGAPPVVDRVELPPLPSRLYHALVKAAIKQAVPLDELAEFILRQDCPTLADLRAERRAAARDLELREREAAVGTGRAVCRHSGRWCPNPFRWRGVVRCGCDPVPSIQ